MKTYFDVYLPIANILIESKHEYTKSPGTVIRAFGNNVITRKPKSGERLHFDPNIGGYGKRHDPTKGEVGGHLARMAKELHSGSNFLDRRYSKEQRSELKKQLVQRGSKTDPLSLGKGSKSARRVAALKAKKGIKESKHEYRKHPGKVYRYGGVPYISRKHKSGEILHILGKDNVKTHMPNTGEYGGQLARIAKGRDSQTKKFMVKLGSKTDPYSLGKGSKAKRRIAALKAKK